VKYSSVITVKSEHAVKCTLEVTVKSASSMECTSVRTLQTWSWCEIFIVGEHWHLGRERKKTRFYQIYSFTYRFI